MSFGKSAFIFMSGMVVGAASLTAFAGYKAYKMLKKNEVLYSAVEASVKAGVESASSEMSNRVAKMGMDFIFGKKEQKPRFGNRITYNDYYTADKTNYKRAMITRNEDVMFYSKEDAERVLYSLKDIAVRYHEVYMMDLYDLSGLECEYQHFNKGWTVEDVKCARIEQHISGLWYIDLPEPKIIRRNKE